MDYYRNSSLRTAIDGFYTRFQELKTDIESLISEEKHQLNVDAKQADFDLASKKLTAIRDEFKAALVYLPAYDQKSYQEGIKEIEKSYNLGLQRLQPTPKFSFKKRGLLDKSAKNVLSEGSIPCSSPTQRNVATLNSTAGLKDDSIRISTHTSKVIEFEDYINPSNISISKSVQLSKLELCVINLFSLKQAIAALYLDDLVNCIVFAPPISNSVLINNCKGCLFFLACHQFRMHNTRDTQVILHVSSNPIIEDCKAVSFGPYNIRHSHLKEISEKTGLLLVSTSNKYNLVEDFNWLKQSASPNWHIVPKESQNKLSVLDIEETINRLKNDFPLDQAMKSLL